MINFKLKRVCNIWQLTCTYKNTQWTTQHFNARSASEYIQSILEK